MSEIDERVVEMRFDNKEFEKNVQTSIKTLDQLQDALKLEGSTKGLDDLQRSANKFNMDGLIGAVDTVTNKFDALGVMGVTALVKITNQAIDAGEKLIKSLSVDNISAGWEKFGEKTTAVGTLIGQNFSMDEVNDQMERLNWFTDETSYNFTDMVNNISKFTATGKDLEDSVSAMEGIALWAAASGQNATKASMAMYQLSQAMGKGVLKYDDWRSIQNASMDTKEFREQALGVAEALGTVKKVSEDIYEVNGKTFTMAEMFASDALSKERWFTDDVMMNTFQKYNQVSDQIREYVEEQESLGRFITSSQAIEELGDDLDALGVKWFKAGMEARTFHDVLDATKDAVSTGWMNTFELIFGNYEEATKTWTDLCQVLYELFAEGGNARNEMLAWWKDLGGRTALLQAVSLAFNNLKDVVSTVSEAFHKFFTDNTAARGSMLADLTGELLRVAEGMKLTDKAMTAVYDAFSGIFSVVKLAIDGFATFLSILSPLLTPLNLLGGYAFEAVGALGNLLTSFTKSVKHSRDVSSAIEFIRSTVQNLANGLTFAVYAVGEFIRAFDPLTKVKNGLATIVKIVTSVGRAFVDAITQFSGFTKAVEVLQVILFGIVSVIYTVATRMQELFENGPLRFAALRLEGILVNAAERIGAVFGMLADKLAPLFVRLAGSVYNFFANVISGVNGVENFGVLDALAYGVDLVVTAFETAGNAVAGFLDNIASVAAPVQSVNDSAQAAINGIGQWAQASGALDKPTKTIGNAATKFQAFFDLIASYAKKIDVMSIALIGFGASSAYMMWQIGGAMASVSKLIKGFSDIPSILEKAVKGFARNTPTKAFLEVAKAIALLAGSLALLTLLDTGKLAVAAGVMIALGAAATAMAYGLSSFENTKELSKNARSLLVLSGAILVLTFSLAALEKIEFNHLLKSLGILAAFGIGLVAASHYLNLGAKAGLKPAISLLIFAFAIDKMVKAFKRLSSEFESANLQDVMTTLITLVLGVMAMAYAAGKLNIGKAAGLLVICAVLSMTINAIKTVSNAGIDPAVIFGIFAVCVALIGLFTLLGYVMDSAKRASVNAKASVTVIPTILAFAGAVMLIVLAIDKLMNMGLGMNNETRTAIFALVAIMGSLLLVMKLMNKIGENAKGTAATAIAIGITLALMAKAFSVMAGTDTDHPYLALAYIVAISACLAALVNAAKYTKKAKPSVILSMAAVLGVVAVMVGILSNFTDVGKAVAVCIGLGVVFALLGVLFSGMSDATKDVDGKVALAFMGMIGFVTAALIALSLVPVEQAAAAAIGVSAVMLVFAFAINSIAEAAKNAKDAMSGAKAILVASLAIIPAALALAIVANTNLDGLGPAIVALGICMFGIWAMSKYAEPALQTAATMVIMAASLVVAAKALEIVAGLDPNGLIQAGIALGVVVGVFAILGAIAGNFPMVGAGMIIVAAALGILAIALVGIAAAAYLFASAVDIIANAILKLSSVTTEEAQRIAENLPVIMAAFGEGLADGLFAFIEALIVNIVGAIGKLLETVLGQGPQFLQAGIQLIEQFITGMLSVAGQIVQSIANILVSAVDTIVGFIETFASMGVAIVSAIVNGVISVGSMLIVGVLQLLGNVALAAQNILIAFIDLGANIVTGLAAGIQHAAGYALDAITNLGNEIINGFCEFFGIHSPSVLMAAMSEFLPAGVGEGITNATPIATAAADAMGIDVVSSVGEYINFDTGSAQGSDYANGVISGYSSKLNGFFENFQLPEIGGEGGAGLFQGGKSLFDEWKAKEELRKTQKAAMTEQERLEREMGWNQKKTDKKKENPLEKLTEGLTDSGKGGKGGGGGGGAGKAAKDTSKAFDTLTHILDYASGAVDEFNSKWASTQEWLGEEDSINASTDALELLALQLYKTSIATEDAEDAAKRAAKSQGEILADVKKAYQDVRNEFRKTMDEQTDMFEMFDYGEAVKSGDMVGRFESNLEAIETYSDQLDKLAERGLDNGLLQNFAKQGPKALGKMKAFVEATDEEFQQLNEMWRREKETLDTAADKYMSTLAYSMAGGEEAFTHLIDPETGEDTGVTYMENMLAGMRASLNLNLQNFEAVGQEIAAAVSGAMTDAGVSQADADAAVSEIGNNVTEAANTITTGGDAELIGKNLCEGVAKGIRDNASLAVDAAVEMAVAALTAAKEALDIHSPSGAFEELGFRSDQGLANGFIKNVGLVRDAADATADATLDEISGVFGRIADIVDGRIDLDPTIRPVLDLSNLQYGAASIGSILGLNDPYALNATASITGIQNDASMIASMTDSLKNAINGLKTDGDSQPVVINIYTQPGQNSEEIADYVAWKFNHDLNKRKAARGGR